MENTDEGLIVDMLTGMFGDFHIHNEYRHQISFDCPVCSYDIKGLDKGDGKGNLEVNYADHVFKCWACAETHNTKGHLGWLIERYGGKKDKQYYELIRPDEFVKGDKQYKKLVLPKEYHKFEDVSDIFPEKRRAMNYLKGRGITQDIIDKYDIGFAYEGDYAGRIIVPSYDLEGELNYFVSRTSTHMDRFDAPRAMRGYQSIHFHRLQRNQVLSGRDCSTDFGFNGHHDRR